MPRVKYLAFLILLALWPTQSKAVVTIVQRCVNTQASTVNGATISCSLANTSSGNKIIVNGFEFGTSNAVTGTESFTCPSSASIYHTYAGNNRGTYICYVDTASSHATFTITSTVTCPPCAGTRQIMAYEVSGLSSSDDAGSEAAAAANTVNFTTANASEFAFASGYDVCQALSPASSFTQIHQIVMTPLPTTQADRLMAQSKTTGSAGSNIASFTCTSSFPAQLIAVIAFQVSGGPPAPQIKVVQGCSYLRPSGNPTPVTCRLTNTTSGNKLVLLLFDNAPGVANSVGSCDTETCVCPTNAGITHTYGGNVYTVNICYADAAAGHSVIDLGVGVTGGGNAVVAVHAYEVSGLNTGIDAGSEAGAAATSVNFTTASNNEWAIFAASDTGTNALIPGSGFGQVQYAQHGSTVTGELGGFQTITSAGSNTASYTQTGSSTPMIAVAAFAFTPSSTTRSSHATVIDFKPHRYKVPWDNRKRKLQIVSI